MSSPLLLPSSSAAAAPRGTLASTGPNERQGRAADAIGEPGNPQDSGLPREGTLSGHDGGGRTGLSFKIIRSPHRDRREGRDFEAALAGMRRVTKSDRPTRALGDRAPLFQVWPATAALFSTGARGSLSFRCVARSG